jgi:hypothetical protein
VQTIVELLKTPGENVSVNCGDTRLFWDDDLKAWVVWKKRRYRHHADTWAFRNECMAVAEFCERAMIEPQTDGE